MLPFDDLIGLIEKSNILLNDSGLVSFDQIIEKDEKKVTILYQDEYTETIKEEKLSSIRIDYDTGLYRIEQDGELDISFRILEVKNMFRKPLPDKKKLTIDEMFDLIDQADCFEIDGTILHSINIGDDEALIDVTWEEENGECHVQIYPDEVSDILCNGNGLYTIVVYEEEYEISLSKTTPLISKRSLHAIS